MGLAEQDDTRTVPIWVGPVEAISLGMDQQSAETPCPFSYKPAAGPA
jgi:bifunctional DNase/RNase